MTSVTFAANNGDMGGGEVMLLRMAETARATGLQVTVVGPRSPDELIETACAGGFASVAIPADSRAAYMRGLRSWDRRHRIGHLWCNGLVPALATAGRPRRVVHLHQLPEGVQRPAAFLASLGASRLVVPSAFMAAQVRGARVLSNWTVEIQARAPADRALSSRPVRLGFLGRLSQDKGVDTLARAVGIINAETPGAVELRVAGDYRFVAKAQQDTVRRSLAELGEDVLEMGWMSNTSFFSEVDVVVFPSTWGEPFGLVAAESMAAGVPLVVSDAGALPEVVGPDHPWVAPAGNDVELASVIRAAMAIGSSAVTDRARVRWEKEFSPAAGTERYRRLLEELGLVRQ